MILVAHHLKLRFFFCIHLQLSSGHPPNNELTLATIAILNIYPPSHTASRNAVSVIQWKHNVKQLATTQR